MHLVSSDSRFKSVPKRILSAGTLLTGLWLVALGSFSPVAHAAAVSYLVSPSGSNVQPGSTFDVLISVKTDVEIAGGSLHIDYGNGNYEGFQSAGSPSLSFVDYHEGPADIVFICNNNNCAPGIYQVAIISIKAGTSGTTTINYSPRETADPDLNLMAADGTSSSHVINSSAPASTSRRNNSSTSQNTYTIPQDDGNGGIEPLQVTNDQYIQKTDQAEDLSESVGGDNKWSALNILLLGLGVGIGLAAFLFILFKLFGKSSGNDNRPGPYTSGGSGTAIVG